MIMHLRVTKSLQWSTVVKSKLLLSLTSASIFLLSHSVPSTQFSHLFLNKHILVSKPFYVLCPLQRILSLQILTRVAQKGLKLIIIKNWRGAWVAQLSVFGSKIFKKNWNFPSPNTILFPVLFFSTDLSTTSHTINFIYFIIPSFPTKISVPLQEGFLPVLSTTVSLIPETMPGTWQGLNKQVLNK